MFSGIAIAIILVFAGALAWMFRLNATLRRQLASYLKASTGESATSETVSNERESAHESAGQLQQALEESKRRFDLVRKAAEDVIYDLDVATGKLEWSDSLYATYGHERSDSTETVEWWTEHVHPDDALKINEAMDEMSDPSATNWQVEYRFRKADDTYVPVRDRSFILRNSAGEPTHLIGSIRDISLEQQTS